MKKCVNCLNNDQHKTHTHTYTSAVYTDINTYIYICICMYGHGAAMLAPYGSWTRAYAKLHLCVYRQMYVAR